MRSTKATAAVAASLLFVPAPAAAQGITSGLAGLREVLFVYWGVAGVVPALLLLVAFARYGRHGRRTASAVLLSLPAALYAPTAIALIFVPSNDLAAKLPGLVGFGLLVASLSFWLPQRTALRSGLQATAAASAVVLTLTPNSFWKVPLLSLEARIFVDNLPAGAHECVSATSVPNEWVALDDGRRLLQTHPATGGRAPRRFPRGERVVLGTPSPGGGDVGFALTFFQKTAAYRDSLSSPAPRFVVPLGRSVHDRYEKVATSQAVLLEEDAAVDYAELLLQAVGNRTAWNLEPTTADHAAWRGWVLAFIELGGIDIESPGFLDRLFATNEDHTGIQVLMDMGMDPRAVDSGGNSVLHVAARRGDLSLFRRLLTYDVDPAHENAAGHTALDVARMRHRAAPERTPLAGMELALEMRRADGGDGR